MLPLALTGQQKCQCQISLQGEAEDLLTVLVSGLKSVPRRRPEPTVQKRGGQMQL